MAAVFFPKKLAIADVSDVLYGPACILPTIPRFHNWLQIWTTTYLQRSSTILITFCTSYYLPELTTLTISDRIVIPFHYMLKMIRETL